MHNTHVLKPTAVGRETLIQRNGITLVVLPVGDTRGNHPFLLFLSSRLAGRTAQNRGRRTWGTTRNLLVLEPWRLQRVLNNFRHLDDALLQAIRVALLTRSVADEGRLALAIGNVLRLSSFDLAVYQLLQCSTRLVGRCLNFVLRRPFQCAFSLVEILTVGKGDKILELGLDDLACALTLERDGVVTNVAFRVDLQCQGVTRGSLNVFLVSFSARSLDQLTFFLPKFRGY